MSHYKPYPAYKNSGVEWLDEIPSHWTVKPLRWIGTYQNSNVDKKSYEGQAEVRLCNYTDVYYSEFITNSMEFMVATASAAEIESMALRKGDIIITKDSEDPMDIGIPAIVAEDLNNVICGYHLTIIRVPEEYQRFVHRLIQSDPTKARFYVESPGITRYGLNQQAIGGLPLLLPPPEEAVKLADYIDAETTRIDALVEKKANFIELLREHRQALVTHAVSKGLDHEVPMKDSGLEWLGPVPGHWKVKPLKYIAAGLTVGIVVNPSEYVSEEGLPYIYGGDISEGKIEFASARKITAGDSSKNEKTVLRAGDLLTVRVGAPGVTAVVPPECDGGNCASVMLIRRGNFDSEWLCYAMNSRMVRYQVEVVQYGAAQEQFNISHAVDFLIATPPREEQEAISKYLNRETKRINNLIQKTERSIELLKEHRSAFITAAATGQIDLREPTVAWNQVELRKTA